MGDRRDASLRGPRPPSIALKRWLRLRTPFGVRLALIGLIGLCTELSSFSSPKAGELTGGMAPRIEPSESDGNWRHVHSPNPGGTTTTSALLRIADLERSDPRLAGLMLRCNGHDIDAILVVVEPFPPRAQPKITLRVGNQESYFSGSLIPTGVGVRLPVDGIALATGPWRAATELKVEIADGGTRIEGVVGLSGLATAIAGLSVDCAQK